MSSRQKARGNPLDWPELVAGVGHELANIACYVAIVVNGGVGRPGGPADSRRGAAGPNLERGLDRISSLSKSVSEIGFAGRDAELPMRLLWLQDIALEAVVAVRQAAESRAVDVTIRALPGEEPSCFGSRDLLITAVRRLLDNAIQYSARGGSIEVRVEADRETSRLVVLDEAIGLEAGEEELVLNPFYRGRRQVEATQYGVGLGLTVAAVIAARHEGAIRVACRKGAGLAVALELPSAARSKGRAKSEAAVRSRRMELFLV